MTDHSLTQKELKEFLHYDPDTGIVTWKERDRKYCYSDQSWKCFNTQHFGNVAGHIDCSGYRIIEIFGSAYKAHRLAFLYMLGRFPSEDVDHISGVRADNRWSNIREVSGSENSRNSKLSKQSKTGIPGVCWHKGRARYQITICIERKGTHLGRHKDFFEACCIRKSAELKYGYHENHGRR